MANFVIHREMLIAMPSVVDVERNELDGFKRVIG